MHEYYFQLIYWFYGKINSKYFYQLDNSERSTRNDYTNYWESKLWHIKIMYLNNLYYNYLII